jgi:hypothetical protein
VLVTDPCDGIELGVVLVLHPEIGAERTESDTATGLDGSGHTGENVLVLLISPEQSERPLAERNGGVELALEAQVPSIGPRKRGTVDGLLGCDVDETLTDVDAMNGNPPPSKLVGMATWPAPDIEQAHPARQLQQVDQGAHFLCRALGERVPQIGRPHVLGQRFEPVVRHTATLA